MSAERSYRDPVAKLLEIGELAVHSKWKDYREYGISSDDIPELIEMAVDLELNLAEQESKEAWAPVHAWRALGQLRAERAINPLINLFHQLEEDDWIYEEMPEIFEAFGPPALPALAAYLAYPYRNPMSRIVAGDCIYHIGRKYSEVKGECIRIFMDQLKIYEKNDPTLNAFLIEFLIDLNAMNSIDLIKKAFESGCVDETEIGWDYVRENFPLINPAGT